MASPDRRDASRDATHAKRDALYARYSSHAQDDSTSVSVQIEACERAAGKPLERYIDEAKTGRTTGGRGELLRLIGDAEAGRIGRLYVYKFDRLGRSAGTHILVEDLESCGVEVISVTEGTNALARGVQLVVAADFSRVLAERTRAGLAQRHREGCWTGGPPPYGYQIVSDAAGKRRLAICEPEAATVRFIFETYLAEAVGFKEVARRLRERGIPTRLGGPWNFGTVRSVLTNRMLVGEVRYLRRSFKLNRATGRRLPRFNGESHHLVQREESLRVISDEMFRRAQERIAANAVDRPRPVAEVRPFTRHLFCACCGSVCYSRKSRNAKGEYRYYGCGRRQSIGPDACVNAATIREDKLLARVHEGMSAVFADLDGLLNQIAAMAGEALSHSRSEASRIASEIAEIDRTLTSLSRLILDPEIEALAKRAVSRQMAECEAKRELLGKALEAAAIETVGDMDELMDACRQAILEARSGFSDLLSPVQMNRFVAEVVGPMTMHPDGSVTQKETAPEADASGAVTIAGAGFEPATSGL